MSHEWTSNADLALWTLDGLVIDNGDLRVADGESQGTAVIEYEDTDWTADGGWTRAVAEGYCEPGATYLVRYKVAATQAGLTTADFTPWQDGVDASGRLAIGMDAMALNDVRFAAGPWMRIELMVRNG